MERRKHRRTGVTVEADICHPGGECIGRIRDLGPRSLFVEVGRGSFPAAGSLLKINFLIWTGDCHISRQARGEVSRVDEQGVAIVFAEQDGLARAAIDEILFYMRMMPLDGHLLSPPDAA